MIRLISSADSVFISMLHRVLVPPQVNTRRQRPQSSVSHDQADVRNISDGFVWESTRRVDQREDSAAPWMLIPELHTCGDSVYLRDDDDDVKLPAVLKSGCSCEASLVNTSYY